MVVCVRARVRARVLGGGGDFGDVDVNELLGGGGKDNDDDAGFDGPQDGAIVGGDDNWPLMMQVRASCRSCLGRAVVVVVALGKLLLLR